jgi:pimeloyl-ACP methyl ester carboxylesterase
MSDRLRIRRGGSGDPVLILLHGLGATGDVWRGLIELLDRRWSGRWIAPDLPGHGGSGPLAGYSFGAVAAEVGRVAAPTDRVAILGHSAGGVVALTLASGWFGLRVDAVAGLGIKVAWTEEELTRARALASKPNPVFPTRAEAAERHLKLAGLASLMTVESVADAAVVRTDAGWRAAFDPAGFAIGAPDMPGLLAAAKAPVILAAGERDPMCSEAELRALVSDPVILAGLGHNAHVEEPEALWPILDRMAGRIQQ